jgi:hypothetical protein
LDETIASHYRFSRVYRKTTRRVGATRARLAADENEMVDKRTHFQQMDPELANADHDACS